MKCIIESENMALSQVLIYLQPNSFIHSINLIIFFHIIEVSHQFSKQWYGHILTH